MKATMSIRSAGLTHVGRVRELNEDAFFLNERLGLFVVADGMGGHKAGEVASAMVADTVLKSMRSMLRGEVFIPPKDLDDSMSLEANMLRAAIRDANEAVHEKAIKDKDCQGMGSTVSALLCTGFSLITANVGDSPIYLFRKGQIIDLFNSHTRSAESGGRKSGNTVTEAHQDHVLTRAVGKWEQVEVDVFETQAMDSDTVVLCSDGLSDHVPAVEIQTLALEHGPEKACNALVELANQRGGHDNITVVVVTLCSRRSFLGRLTGNLTGFLKK